VQTQANKQEWASIQEHSKHKLVLLSIGRLDEMTHKQAVTGNVNLGVGTKCNTLANN